MERKKEGKNKMSVIKNNFNVYRIMNSKQGKITLEAIKNQLKQEEKEQKLCQDYGSKLKVISEKEREEAQRGKPKQEFFGGTQRIQD